MRLNEKEVAFCLYCQDCEHREKSENMEPCWDCLTEGMRLGTHQPLYFSKRKERETKKPSFCLKRRKKHGRKR